MSIVDEKLDILRANLGQGDPPQGALLIVYPPEEELSFREGYDEVIQELKARNIGLVVIDFRILIFDSLKLRNKLESVLADDAQGKQSTYQSMAKMAQKEAEKLIFVAAKEAPNAVLFCKHTASLFPWVSFAEILKKVENEIENTLVIPFPGTESGPILHFLAAKDGYDYRATRI